MSDQLLPDEVVMSKIYLVRDQKVMLDIDLAELYGVETRVLKQAVRRNMERFPDDFMFELNQKEKDALRSQSVILKRGEHSKYLPYAFTEQGVAMLSSILKSKTAVAVNIQIIRIFTRLREMLLTHKDILIKLEQIESRLDKHDSKIELLFNYLGKLVEKEDKPRNRIGYKPDSK